MRYTLRIFNKDASDGYDFDSLEEAACYLAGWAEENHSEAETDGLYISIRAKSPLFLEDK